jgi:hypothetical protein
VILIVLIFHFLISRTCDISTFGCCHSNKRYFTFDGVLLRVKSISFHFGPLRSISLFSDTGDLDVTVSCLSRPTANDAPIMTPNSQVDTTFDSVTASVHKLHDVKVVDSVTRNNLIDEQKSDDSLLECRRMADAHRNNLRG